MDRGGAADSGKVERVAGVAAFRAGFHSGKVDCGGARSAAAAAAQAQPFADRPEALFRLCQRGTQAGSGLSSWLVSAASSGSMDGSCCAGFSDASGSARRRRSVSSAVANGGRRFSASNRTAPRLKASAAGVAAP